MKFTCPNKKCPSKNKPQSRIGVLSECVQSWNMQTDEYNDLEVQSTLYGFCLECGEKIRPKTFKRLQDSAT